MTGTRDITQLRFSSNFAGIVMGNKIEQSFYSVCFYSGLASIERALSLFCENVYENR